MDMIWMTLILLLVLLALLGVGLWVAFSLTAIGCIALFFFSGIPVGDSLATAFYSSSVSWELAALPMFIWMGEVLFRSRLSEEMFRGIAPWVGRIPGRLLHTNIIGCGIFAAISGSSAATAATIGKMTLPELERRGYNKNQVLGTLAGSATLGLSPQMLLVVLTLFFILLGCFLDGISVVVLTTSIILPMVQAAGIDPLWFGIYLVIVVEMSQITPPVGFNLFVIQGLTGENILRIAWAAFPYFLLILLSVILITIFPEIATYLPSKMGK